MELTDAQLRVLDNVLSIFETGGVVRPSAYQTCTVLADGAGISYGKHQATDRAGSLDRIVKRYIQAKGTHADALQPYVARLAANETATLDRTKLPQWTKDLVALLKVAGGDPIMQQAQDDVFAEDYRTPALGLAASLGLKEALSALVFYDTAVHSGPGGIATIRQLFPEVPPSKGGCEHSYIRAYVDARREWLASRANALVRGTVYRMDALRALMQTGNWALTTPLVVRGVRIE
jgi:hypothetical protein